MPENTGLNSGLASPTDESPLALPEAQLYTVEERGQLRAMFASDLFRKALANARLSRPPLFVAGADSALGTMIASHRLHQLQGWALFEAALIKETIVPGERRRFTPDTYPDEARIDYQRPQPPVVTPPPNVPMTESTTSQKRRRTKS